MSRQVESRRFPGTLASLKSIREFVTAGIQGKGVDPKRVYPLILGVDEIATNIIVHGYEEAGLSGLLDVRIEVDDRELRVILEDEAVPFDPLSHQGPIEEDLSRPLDERPIGGLGVMLAKEGADEFRYERKEGRNRNIFVLCRGAAA